MKIVCKMIAGLLLVGCFQTLVGQPPRGLPRNELPKFGKWFGLHQLIFSGDSTYRYATSVEGVSLDTLWFADRLSVTDELKVFYNGLNIVETKLWACRGDSISINSFSVHIDSRENNLRHFSISGMMRFDDYGNETGVYDQDTTFVSSHFKNDTIRQVSINAARISNLELDGHCRFDIFDLSWSTITNKVMLEFEMLPKILNLSNLRLDSGASLTIRYRWPNPNGSSTLFIDHADIDRVDLDYSYFVLDFSKGTKAEEKKRVYGLLKDKFERSKMMVSFERIDKHYQEFLHYYSLGEPLGGWIDWLDWWWWDYGYKKQWIIRGSAVLFLFFVLLNSFFFDHLLDRGYTLEKFVEIEREREYPPRSFVRYFSRLTNVLLYTAFIFWGFKLDIDSINVRSGWVYYIIFQYLVGIVCVAYLANFIITR